MSNATPSVPVADDVKEALYLSANGKTEEERVLALAYWLDRQTFQPAALNCAAETLRSYVERFRTQDDSALAVENATLRAQLAGRDALLRRIAGHHIDGNIRTTVRDCVNGLPDVQDIYGYCDEIDAEIEAVLSASAEPEEKAVNTEFKHFAICDTCAVETYCLEIGDNEHICGGCHSAPQQRAEREAELQKYAEAQATIVKLEARIAELERGQAKPYAYEHEWASWISTKGPKDFKVCIERDMPPHWAIASGQAKNIKALYTVQPAPGAVALPGKVDEEFFAKQGYSKDLWADLVEIHNGVIDATAALNEVKA
jgi:hypothetical protein